MLPGFVIFGTSWKTIDEIDLIVRPIFEDLFFHDFNKHFAGDELAFSHKLADLDSLLAISFDEFPEEITSGEMIEAVLFNHVGALGALSRAWSAKDENNLGFIFFLQHKLKKKINLKDLSCLWLSNLNVNYELQMWVIPIIFEV